MYIIIYNTVKSRDIVRLNIVTEKELIEYYEKLDKQTEIDITNQ